MRGRTAPPPPPTPTPPPESPRPPPPAAAKRPPVSPRKLAANRANATRSTGPRTAAGKARSAMNALRHGLVAHASLLPGEDAHELEELALEMHEDLRPRGTAQRELVARVVSIVWRLRRAARAEEALWQEREEQELSYRERRGAFAAVLPQTGWDSPADEHVPDTAERFVARQLSGTRGASPLERLAVYEQRLDRALHAAMRQLQQLQKIDRARQRDDGAEQDVA